jgi:hydrogenase maturation protein HypF
VLAVGGELKATLCLARDHEATMSQHIGDLGSLETLETLERSATHLISLTGVQPAAVVADLHPGYASTRWAREFAVTRGIPCLQVQHHEAHVASLLAEHGRDAAGSPGVIGVCFDGTGYGSNGTIHGGEFFVCDGPLPRRAAHLMPFPLPGGDVAIRHPWRVALALLRHARLPWNDTIPSVRAASAGDRDILARQLDRQLACTDTTSMGRLFDAVASLTGVRQSIDYEAEAALNLETLAAAENLATTGRPYLLPTHATVDGPITIDSRPLVRAVVADVEAGESPGSMAARFHAAVAGMIVKTCILLRDRGAGATVGLTGGVFQNAWLVERSLDGLHAAGFEVLTHHTVPPNDGGLALGQVVLGRALLASAVPSL